MAQAAVARPAVRWRLGAGTRKGVLLVHIASAGAWLGVDVVMAVLVFRALLTDDGRAKALSFRALELIAVGPLLACGLLCLLSGILLGLSSKYGLVRYWWVAVKLVANVVLTSLVLVALRPGVVEAAEIGRSIASDERLAPLPSQLMFPPIVSTTTLVIAVLLAVYKPWGRVRKR